MPPWFHRARWRFRGARSVPGRWPVGRSTGSGSVAAGGGSSFARIAFSGSSRGA